MMMLYLGTQTYTQNESYKINFFLLLTAEYVSRRQLFPDISLFRNAYSQMPSTQHQFNYSKQNKKSVPWFGIWGSEL